VAVTDLMAKTRAGAIPRPASSGFIVGPAFDWVYFILAPLWALALGLIIAQTSLNDDAAAFGFDNSWANFLLGAFIFAHLFVVVFRSHLNPRVFRLYPTRFTLVPVLLFISFMYSAWILVIGSVLATFWDVWHSGQQTFGLGRIYDARAGNDPRTGRVMDMILNALLYAGPIAAGATLMDHVEDFQEFADVGAAFFTAIPAQVESNAQYLTWAVIGLGLPFLVFYLYYYWRRAQAGYRVSPQKIILLVSTGVTSIWAWAFNPFGMAFFIMNFFHALQYFALVWWSEKGNIARIIGVQDRPWAGKAALLVLIGVGGAYGLLSELGPPSDMLYALFLVVSLMHFWYDGFIWSVRRKEV